MHTYTNIYIYIYTQCRISNMEIYPNIHKASPPPPVPPPADPVCGGPGLGWGVVG